MPTEYELRQGLFDIAQHFAPAVTNLAKVKSVNEDECTCVLEDEDGQPFYDVRLRPITGGNRGFVQIPKIGSMVMAVRVEDSEEWTVIACDEIDKVQVLINNDSVANIMKDFITAIRKMKFTTNHGPTIRLINDVDFVNIQNRLNKILK